MPMRKKTFTAAFIVFVIFVSQCVVSFVSAYPVISYRTQLTSPAPNIDDNTLVYFSDSFEGLKLDENKWAVLPNANATGFPAIWGSISVSNGSALLTSKGTTFPCVRTASNPFPETGDFALVFTMSYPSIGTYGDGFWVSKGLFSPEGWLISESAIPPKNSTNQNVIQIWADPEGGAWVGFFGDLVFKPGLVWRPGGVYSTEDMVFRLEYTGGVYTLYMNGKELASRESQVRPDTIGFGSPPLYYLPLLYSGLWSSLKIDAISVLPTAKISLATGAELTNLGLSIEINGTLVNLNGQPIIGGIVILSYLISGGASWCPFASAVTDSNGAFVCSWMPQASGNFSIRAQWIGDETCPGTFQTKNISVSSNVNQQLFFVESNSTLSSLAFNSSSNELTFRVGGSTGTDGYVRFLVSKSILPNAVNLVLNIDNQQIEYSISSAGQSWLLFFTYHHSEHTVCVRFPSLTTPELIIPSSHPTQHPTLEPTLEPTQTATPTNGDNQTLDLTPIILVAVIAIAVVVGVLVCFMKRKRS